MEFITSIFNIIKKEQQNIKTKKEEIKCKILVDDKDNNSDDSMYIFTFAPHIKEKINFENIRNNNMMLLYCDKEKLLPYVKYERNPAKISFYEEEIYGYVKYSKNDFNEIVNYYNKNEYNDNNNENIEKLFGKISKDLKVLQSRYINYNSYLIDYNNNNNIENIFRKFFINFFIIINENVYDGDKYDDDDDNDNGGMKRLRLTRLVQFWNYINNSNKINAHSSLKTKFIPIVFEAYFKDKYFYQYYFIDSIFSKELRENLYNEFFEAIIYDNIQNVDSIILKAIGNISKISYMGIFC